MRRKTTKQGLVSAVIAAGGRGTRMEAEINKIFLEVCGLPVLAHTLLAFEQCAAVDELIIAAAEEDMLGCRDITEEFGISKVKTITKGGTSRTQSVANGIAETNPEAELILIHDAARPLIRPEDILRVIDAAREHGASALAVRAKNTIKRADADGLVLETLNRDALWEMQTPQAFRAAVIRDIYQQAATKGASATDDCALAEQAGIPVRLTEGDYSNIKLTTPEDLLLAEALFAAREDALL